MPGIKRWILAAWVALAAGGAVCADENTPPAAELAQSAIADAQAAVLHATALNALWTSAEEALKQARMAMREGNLAMAIEQARIAQQHAELGIGQTRYPLFR